MGTDIHFYIEQRDGGGKWQLLDPVEEGWDFGLHLARRAAHPEWYDAQWDLPRNYSLFAMLAGVRNGSGFAGTDLGDPVVPISEPRGLPDDLSPQFDPDSVDHTPSWLSLRELIETDWSQPITHRCMVDDRETDGRRGRAARIESFAREYGELNGGSCGAIFGPDAEFYQQIEWAAPWRKAAGAEFFSLLVLLTKLSGGDLDSIRGVFYFDS